MRSIHCAFNEQTNTRRKRSKINFTFCKDRLILFAQVFFSNLPNLMHTRRSKKQLARILFFVVFPFLFSLSLSPPSLCIIDLSFGVADRICDLLELEAGKGGRRLTSLFKVSQQQCREKPWDKQVAGNYYL